MNSLAFCALFFLISFLIGKRSRLQGLCAVLFVGYIHGILRANIIDTFSHFYFDSALVGYYLTQPWKAKNRDEARRGQGIETWLQALLALPLLLVLLPMQTFMISLVGLRGNAFFLPALLIGARLSGLEFYRLCGFVAILNIAVFGLSLAEYSSGVEQFYPPSATTAIIYNSNDMDGQLRIPGSFVTAHVHGGTMLNTLPLLIGGLLQGYARRWHQILLFLGVLTTLGGVVLSSTRTNLVMAALLIFAVLSFRGVNKKLKFSVIVLAIVGIGIMANSPSFSRMKTVLDSDTYSSRIATSVNRSFFEVISEYPMGNGLGGGGTSIPHFLVAQLRNPVSVENEYARIALEQGLIGLALWITFIAWYLMRPGWPDKNSWSRCQSLCRILTILGLASSLIGTGMLTAIPASFLFLLLIGWVASDPPPSGITHPSLLPSHRSSTLALAPQPALPSSS